MSEVARRGRRRRERPAMSRGARLARDVALVLVAALVVSFLLKSFVVRSFFIPSGSMEQTLRIDDRILVEELTPRFLPISRGDVVVFRDPGGWLHGAEASSDPGVLATVLDAIGIGATGTGHLVKRVIGLPGDHVTCCTDFGQMTVNGVPLEEPYTDVAVNAPASREAFDVVVPDGRLWVMGDNRDNSEDSRRQGDSENGPYVPIEDVVGRAVLVSWPLGHWAWLGDYPFVFAGVDDAAD